MIDDGRKSNFQDYGLPYDYLFETFSNEDKLLRCCIHFLELENLRDSKKICCDFAGVLWFLAVVSVTHVFI